VKQLASVRRDMGLYDDLPETKSTKQNDPRLERADDAATETEEAERETKRARVERDGGKDGQTSEAAEAPVRASVTTNEALNRIATHMLKPEKFAKASGVLKKLLLGDELERSNAKALYACLENAMSPSPKRALEAKTRYDYEALFEIVAAFAPVIFNAKQKPMVEVWQTYARRINALYTDDSFEFSKAVKDIQQRVDNVESYVEPPLFDEDAVEVPPAPEGVSKEEAKEMAKAYIRSAAAEHAAEAHKLSVEDAKRNALVDALEVADSLYARMWSQTTIDMMSNHFHERRDKFSPEAKRRIEEIWDNIRKKKLARRTGGGQGAMTSFERDAARAANSQVSARGSVGSENICDGRGEAAAKMLG